VAGREDHEARAVGKSMNDVAYDYARADWKHQQHVRRYIARAEQGRLACQECGGLGGWVEGWICDGQGPYETCGFCHGCGYVTRWMRGQWLRWKRAVKPQKQRLEGR
jgi:hypothetical protein